MSETSKYFYLKLKDTFFDSEEIKVLDSMQNGKDYQILYLKLCLLSLKSDGALLFKNMLPYDITMLSTVTNTNIDTVKTGIEVFSKIGLVTIAESGVIFMSDIQTLIGKSSNEAERQKKFRNRIKQKSIENVTNDVTNVTKTAKNVTNVTTIVAQPLNSSTPKKELKRDSYPDFKVKEKSSDFPEQQNSVSPADDAGKRIDSLRVYWNDKGLIPMRLNIFNFTDIDRQSCMAIVSFYTDEEIKNAIDNYAEILNDREKYSLPFPYQSFVGFMAKGVEKFFKAADPFGHFKKNAIQCNAIPQKGGYKMSDEKLAELKQKSIANMRAAGYSEDEIAKYYPEVKPDENQ